MAARTLIRRAAAFGALGLPVLPVMAQETGGLRLTFGIEERIEVGENLALETPEEGTTAEASTRLSFGISSETAIERLSLDTAASLRFAKDPDRETAAEIADPRLALAYARDGANAALTLSANYQRERVETIEITGDDPDLADLQGNGDRADYALNATLDLGTSAPLGVGFRAGLSGADYTDTTDPDLVSSQTISVGSTVRLAFSEVSEGRVALDLSRFEAEDAEQTVRDSSALEFGLTQAVSPRAVLDVALGYSIVDTEEFGVTTREDGPTARVGLTYEMPNGTLDGSLEATNDQNGTRLTLQFGRSLDLPDGTLSARLGVTRGQDEDPTLIGAVNWRKDLPAGSLTAGLSREVASSDDDTEVATTLLTLGYSQDINAVSGLGLDLSYAIIDETAANQVDRADLNARYTRELTDDWDMNFGLTYRLRKEQTEPDTDSKQVFFSLSRQFDLRP